MEKLEYQVKIYKTTDKKKLATGKSQTYEYGAINIRTPELAKHAGKTAKVQISIKNP